ncbi:hypothetical protein N8E86_02025 [Avibacterium paragallinarum]|uniref:hypothetical protein n=1 Tax=Avibacterium paragallinarum TaxID=728 RepID=UPI0021F6B166|nr:hypothetical protein [Avibacterium paragallinarum]UXN35029.1 hypothetical protein N8E86_02025 [Avibacterium paragallinarum]
MYFYIENSSKNNINYTNHHTGGLYACSLIAVIWFVCGYSLAFTPNNVFIGGLDRLFLHGLNVFTAQEQLTVYPGASTIPESVFMLFQMAFAIIAGAIMTGAFAERMKFSAVLIFVGLWTLLVYVPTAHLGLGHWWLACGRWRVRLRGWHGHSH